MNQKRNGSNDTSELMSSVKLRYVPNGTPSASTCSTISSSICSLVKDATASSVILSPWHTSSEASRPECRATFPMALRLTSSSWTTYATLNFVHVQRLTVPVCPLWRQLPNLRLRIRPYPISPCSWYERVTIWGRPRLRLRPKAGLRYL